MKRNIDRHLQASSGLDDRSRALTSRVDKHWSRFLFGFRLAQQRTAAIENDLVADLRSVVETWKETYLGERKEMEAAAADLNVFRVLGFDRDEVRHCRVLAWLLDAKASHYQKALFFQRILRELGLHEDWAKERYSVLTEQSGDESRIDIRVYAEEGFLLDIEVKVDSAEGREQLLRESRDACAFAKIQRIPQDQVCCLFLSKTGYIPEMCGLFKPISWAWMRRVIEGTTDSSSFPIPLALFLKNYCEVIGQFK